MIILCWFLFTSSKPINVNILQWNSVIQNLDFSFCEIENLFGSMFLCISTGCDISFFLEETKEVTWF